jgi:hypothetical protein
MSVSLRRGVAHDNPEVDDDDRRRPWRSLEICENMEPIIDLLIAARTRSLKQWVRGAADEAHALSKAQEEARKVLKDAGE